MSHLNLLSVGIGILIFLSAFAFGFAYRAILKKALKSKPQCGSKNIGVGGRILRASLGIILLALALISDTWQPVLLFFSGFCFFEALFSWCGFFALIGKRSCSIKK